jgi:hypothetical protein
MFYRQTTEFSDSALSARRVTRYELGSDRASVYERLSPGRLESYDRTVFEKDNLSEHGSKWNSSGEMILSPPPFSELFLAQQY